MRKLHKHQNPSTGEIKDCVNAECCLPFRSPEPFKERRAKKVRRSKESTEDRIARVHGGDFDYTMNG